MQISNKMAVSIHYTLTNAKSEQLDRLRNDDPMVYLHGYGQIISGLEEALTAKVASEKPGILHFLVNNSNRSPIALAIAYLETAKAIYSCMLFKI